MFKRMMMRYMEEAGGGSAAGGGAGTGADGGAAAAAAAAAAGSGGTAAAASLLATGAAAQAGTEGTDFIPEKLRVMKEDGSFDLDASGRKLAEAYGALEKRMGAGDVPPKEASEYKITVPDALKEAFDPATDAGMQGFLGKAHAANMTQAQIDLVMESYFEMAPNLAAAGQQLDATAATTELKKVWANDADFTRNVQHAFAGTSAAAQKAGLDANAIINGPLGNNPEFLRLMAALGPEFAEDPGAGGAATISQEDVNSLMASEAYANPRHADHAKVSEKVKKYFDRKHGTEAAG